jgi:predicted enzyme related to lactoylglutathione lyase
MTRVLGVDNVFVEIGDLDEALAFYETGLGLPVHKRFDGMGMVLLSIGDEAPGLGLGVATSPRAGGQKVWLEVDDARALAAEVESKGLHPLTPPFQIPTGWAFEVSDPWGNVIGLTDYSARPELGRT